MRILITTLTLAVSLLGGACSGSTPAESHIDSGRACNGLLYDRCLTEHDCPTAGITDCHSFAADGIEVCTKTCTVGDDASCGTTLDGRPATCNAMGVCKPPSSNDCVGH
jgi:hypothetical protein